MATATGDKYLVTPQSVERHIAQIKELGSVEPVATGRDTPRPAATGRDTVNAPQEPGSEAATKGDMSRQVATETGESPRYVAQLEKRIEEKDAVISLLQNELGHRNEEIVRRNERERETNILIRGLQNLVLQLQPGRARVADVLHDDPLMSDAEGVRHADSPPPAGQ